MGPPKLEDFKVLDTIGRGSHGTVKRVWRKADGQVLVWKELHYASMSEVEKQGLVVEVNVLRSLSAHPHIVRFLHHFVDRRSATLFILMEFCPGGDLKTLVDRCRRTGKRLAESFVWTVLKQVSEALRACHERGSSTRAGNGDDARLGGPILHRDIKPANVFLSSEGALKLGDFGLARTLSSDASFATTFVGTPYYMSPEVMSGQEYTARSDLWSLGCLAYELCAWQPPFTATSRGALAATIKAGK